MPESKTPPIGQRFKKGTSGNPKGRPKAKAKAQTQSVFEVVVEKKLTVTRDGIEQEVSVEEALQQRVYLDAIAGKPQAIRQVLKWIDKREQARFKDGPTQAYCPTVKVLYEDDPSNVDQALLLLGIADHANQALKDLEADRPPLLLEPWGVQAAIRRRKGGTRLTDEDQAEIARCTRRGK